MSDAMDKDATTPDEIWRECADRLRICQDAESENRIAGLKALSFVWGDQWDGDVSNARKVEGRPALTVNHTSVFAARLKNTLRQQRPRIKCHPVGDGADVDTAATVNGLVRHIETLSDASVAYDTGVGSAVDIGWGYWRVNSDYIDEKSFDQELKILPIRNAFTVYMDPSAVHPAGLDQGWCIISEQMKRTEYKRKYPKAENADYRYGDAPGDMVLNWESKTDVRLAEYFRIHEVNDTLCLMSDGSKKLKSELEDPKILQAVGLTVAVDAAGKPITRPTTRCVVQWFRLNGCKVIDKKELPGHYIPVIRCEGNVMDVNGRVQRKGMIQDLMDPARIFNYVETQKAERYALTPKAPWVVAEGQTEGHPEWNNANQSSYSTLIYKPIAGPDGMSMLPPPMRTPPASVESGMSEWSAGAERNLMAVAGMAPENPEISARVVSGNKYLQRRQGMQDLTHYQYYDNQMLAIATTGVILLDLIPHYYDTQRMQRIIGDDGVPQVVGINAKQEADDSGVARVKNDMTVGRYDVVMDTGPGYATKREEAAENMLELLGTPLGEIVVKTGADIVLRNMDFPGADELADRAMVTNPEALGKAVENLPKQAQTIIGSMQQQLQSAQDQIKELNLELAYGRGIAQIKDEGATKREGMKAAASIHNTELKVGADNDNSERDFTGWMHDTDVNRQTALDVAEIRVAGQLLNTNTEASHQRAAADKLIKAGTEDRRPTGV